MQVQVLAFGKIAALTGSAQFALQNISTTAALRAHLEAVYPALKETPYAIAVNKQVVSENTALTEGATVALLPPFSGG